jgi:hypothetical protein
MADAVLGKTEDYVDFKHRVDQLLKDRFSIGFYSNRIRSLLASQVEDAAKIERLSQDAILGKSPDVLRKHLLSRGVDPQTISNVLSVVQTAIAIMSLWKT